MIGSIWFECCDPEAVSLFCLFRLQMIHHNRDSKSPSTSKTPQSDLSSDDDDEFDDDKMFEDNGEPDSNPNSPSSPNDDEEDDEQPLDLKKPKFDSSVSVSNPKATKIPLKSNAKTVDKSRSSTLPRKLGKRPAGDV